MKTQVYILLHQLADGTVHPPRPFRNRRFAIDAALAVVDEFKDRNKVERTDDGDNLSLRYGGARVSVLPADLE